MIHHESHHLVSHNLWHKVCHTCHSHRVTHHHYSRLSIAPSWVTPHHSLCHSVYCIIIARVIACIASSQFESQRTAHHHNSCHVAACIQSSRFVFTIVSHHHDHVKECIKPSRLLSQCESYHHSLCQSVFHYQIITVRVACITSLQLMSPLASHHSLCHCLYLIIIVCVTACITLSQLVSLLVSHHHSCVTNCITSSHFMSLFVSRHLSSSHQVSSFIKGGCSLACDISLLASRHSSCHRLYHIIKVRVTEFYHSSKVVVP